MEIERERELQASSLSRMLKTGMKNIAADVIVDQSKINQIGDASVVFGELYFGSWLLAAMCTLMEPCLRSGCIWCVGEREEKSDAGHVQSHRRRSLEFSGRGSLGELLHVLILFANIKRLILAVFLKTFLKLNILANSNYSGVMLFAIEFYEALLFIYQLHLLLTQF